MSQLFDLVPARDIELSLQNHFTFSVCRKEKRGSPWNEIVRVTGLEQAFMYANKSEAYEIGIFVERDVGGFLYWSSRIPDLFNSTVLEEEHY